MHGTTNKHAERWRTMEGMAVKHLCEASPEIVALDPNRAPELL